MRARVVTGLLMLVLAVVAVASDSAAQAKGPKPKADGVVLPITGTTSTGGRFNGLFALQRFASDGTGGILAVGVISGTVVTVAGDVVGTVLTGPVSLPVADPRLPRTGLAPTPLRGFALAQAATCDVLNLAIGAVDLNVLGLVVHTDPLALEISGDSAGPLGALICLVLNAVGSIVGLLNSILGLLGGLTGGLGV